MSLITYNWFLVVFVDSLVSDILLRVWDAFLYEGTKVGILQKDNQHYHEVVHMCLASLSFV